MYTFFYFYFVYTYLQTKRGGAVSMQSPALHQLLYVSRADVTQAGLKAALLCALMLQPVPKNIYKGKLQNNTTISH